MKNVFAFIAFCLCISSLAAQDTYTASIARIVLDGCGSKAPAMIWVVADNDELQTFEAERVRKTNIWRAEPGLTFDARGRVASLRFNGGRTGCAKSIQVPAREGEYTWAAQFRFTCDPLETWRALTIDNGVALPVNAIRYLPGDVPCKEKTLPKMTTRDLEAVAWKEETIYVQFGNPGTLDYEYYDMLIRNGKFGGTPIAGEVPVKRAALLQQLTIRGGRGTGNADTFRNEFNLSKDIKVVKLKQGGMMRFQRSLLCAVSLMVCVTSHAQLDLFESDDFVEPSDLRGRKWSLVSRIAAGGARGYRDQNRSVGQDFGFVHFANSLDWRALQFDYKHSEVRGENPPPMDDPPCHETLSAQASLCTQARTDDSEPPAPGAKKCFSRSPGIRPWDSALRSGIASRRRASTPGPRPRRTSRG